MGLIGPISFDAAHTSTPPLQQFSFQANGNYLPTGSLPNQVIQKLVS